MPSAITKGYRRYGSHVVGNVLPAAAVTPRRGEYELAVFISQAHGCAIEFRLADVLNFLSINVRRLQSFLDPALELQ